jgi:hypothetical protein
MGRFAELCGDVAAEADASPDGLVLPQEAIERLRESGWVDGDIEDALEFVHATFVQDELIEAADSLSGQLVELLGALDDDARFAEAAAGRARLSLDAIRGLTRRVVRLESVLAPLREGSAVDSTGVERLGRRLVDESIAVGEPRHSPPSRR